MDVAALLQTSESFLLHLEQVYTRDRVSQILQAPAPASSSICYHSRPYSLFSWNTGFLVIPWIFKLVPTSGPLHWKPPPPPTFLRSLYDFPSLLWSWSNDQVLGLSGHSIQRSIHTVIPATLSALWWCILSVFAYLPTAYLHRKGETRGSTWVMSLPIMFSTAPPRAWHTVGAQ